MEDITKRDKHWLFCDSHAEALARAMQFQRFFGTNTQMSRKQDPTFICMPNPSANDISNGFVEFMQCLQAVVQKFLMSNDVQIDVTEDFIGAQRVMVYFVNPKTHQPEKIFFFIR